MCVCAHEAIKNYNIQYTGAEREHEHRRHGKSIVYSVCSVSLIGDRVQYREFVFFSNQQGD